MNKAQRQKWKKRLKRDHGDSLTLKERGGEK